MMKKVKPVMNAEAMTNCSWLVRVDSAYRSDSTLRVLTWAKRPDSW
jgi:hypothetical protein